MCVEIKISRLIIILLMLCSCNSDFNKQVIKNKDRNVGIYENVDDNEDGMNDTEQFTFMSHNSISQIDTNKDGEPDVLSVTIRNKDLDSITYCDLNLDGVFDVRMGDLGGEKNDIYLDEKWVRFSHYKDGLFELKTKGVVVDSKGATFDVLFEINKWKVVN
jgi:hypothetical protein